MPFTRGVAVDPKNNGSLGISVQVTSRPRLSLLEPVAALRA